MTLIFFERKDMILDNLPDILNMVIRRIENFLRAFEKKFWVKKVKKTTVKGLTYATKDVFFTLLAQNFFSNALRKFSTCRIVMFNIFERLFMIIYLRSKTK